MPPSHPEWAPVCPTPCQVRLKVLRPQLYTTTSWWACLAMPVGVPLAPCSGHVRALVGNYTPPTTALRVAAVLVILTSVAGTTA